MEEEFMSHLGFRVLNQFERPSKNLVQRFRGIPVANIADCMNRIFCVDTRIKMINEKKGLQMIGSALTVKTRTVDNLLVHKAIEISQPGDVIVIDAEGDTHSAILGEIMALMAEKKDVAGYLIDGCIRDFEMLREMTFPVFAIGVSPRGPYKDGPGEINFPVSCGGVVINPGDIIVGDKDGVVVIPSSDAEKIYEDAKKVSEKEQVILEDIRKGNPIDRSWIDAKLKEKGCQFI
jgi:RraA family protein